MYTYIIHTHPHTLISYVNEPAGAETLPRARGARQLCATCGSEHCTNGSQRWQLVSMEEGWQRNCAAKVAQVYVDYARSKCP